MRGVFYLYTCPITFTASQFSATNFNLQFAMGISQLRVQPSVKWSFILYNHEKCKNPLQITSLANWRRSVSKGHWQTQSAASWSACASHVTHLSDNSSPVHNTQTKLQVQFIFKHIFVHYPKMETYITVKIVWGLIQASNKDCTYTKNKRIA